MPHLSSIIKALLLHYFQVIWAAPSYKPHTQKFPLSCIAEGQAFKVMKSSVLNMGLACQKDPQDLHDSLTKVKTPYFLQQRLSPLIAPGWVEERSSFIHSMYKVLVHSTHASDIY